MRLVGEKATTASKFGREFRAMQFNSHTDKTGVYGKTSPFDRRRLANPTASYAKNGGSSWAASCLATSKAAFGRKRPSRFTAGAKGGFRSYASDEL